MSLFVAEIKCYEEFQNDVLLQILNSKRLLIDHVEILEECYNEITQKESSHYLTACKLAALGSIPVAISFLSSKFKSGWQNSISALVVAYGTCYGIKCFNKYRYRVQMKQLETFIHSLEQFEMAVRKNLLFLNERQHSREMKDSMEKSGLEVDSFVSNCVKSCVQTIKAVHRAVKQLEQDFVLTDRWDSLYSPIESLEDCELFSETVVANVKSPRDIKDYYNVFAYMQSQLLTRLALAVTCGLSAMGRCGLSELGAKLDDQTALCLSQFNTIVDPNRKRAPRIVVESLSPELSHLRTLTMSLSAKLYSTVHRYNEIEKILDETVTDLVKSKSSNQTQDQLALSMEEIINDLGASADECQRLLITWKKLFNKDDSDTQLEIDARFKEGAEPALDMMPYEDRVFSEQDKPCIKDEFFAVDGTDTARMEEDDRRSSNSIDHLESINAKIIKRHFKPVLVQLRERIVPISVEFKEREKRALRDKGIDVVDSDEEPSADEESPNLPRRTVYSSDSEDDQGRDEREAIKLQRSVQRYEDMRGFLANKEQFNIFGLKPVTSMVEEEVLE